MLTYHSFALHMRSVCSSCIHEKLPFTLGTKDVVMREDVATALGWLIIHPGFDHVDAAFAVVVDPTRPPKTSDIGGKRWPDFLAAVKEAAQNWASVS